MDLRPQFCADDGQAGSYGSEAQKAGDSLKVIGYPLPAAGQFD